MKIKICFMAMLWPVLSVMAQTHLPKYHPLAIGDTVPDMEIRHLLNYPKARARLADFRGKLLILDFWATWCSPCVAAFPKMDSLRKVFGDQLFILPVTDQDEKTVGSLLDHMQKVKGLQGFSAIRDTALSQLFKHTEIPHYVWIDEKGKVIAITSGQEVTKTNIHKVLNHELLFVKMKKDVSKVFDLDQPILAGSNAMDMDSLVFYHVLTKHVDGYYSGMDSRYTPGKGFKLTALNCSVAQLFSLAYSQFKPALIRPKSRILEVKDTAKIKGPDFYGQGPGQGKPAWEQWYQQHTYCYQLIVGHDQLDGLDNQAKVNDVYAIMRQDLAQYFPEYTAGIEKRKIKALVMIRAGQSGGLKTKGGPSEKSDNKYTFHLQNAPWSTFPLRLMSYYLQLSDRRLVDETGITGNVDLDITANLSSVPALRSALRKYSIELIEAEREVEMIVIKDRPPLPDSITVDSNHLGATTP